MELAGKKIVFLGDSITEGHGVSLSENIYVNRLAKMADLKEAKNYGIGGTRFAVQKKPSDNPRHDLDFCQRCEELDADADIVIVFGGTNDFGHGDASIGQMTDRTPETFYGACHYLMNRLIERFPGKPIVFMTPIHRLVEDDPTAGGRKPAPVATLAQYVDIIKEVARFYAIPVLDLYAQSGIQPRVPILQEKFCPDGLHPNDAGQELIANRLYGFLKSL